MVKENEVYKMKQKSVLIFGIGMSIIWSVVFAIALKSWAGIGIGVLFGISFGASSYIASKFSHIKEDEDKKDEDLNDK